MTKVIFLFACMLIYSSMVFSQLTSFDLSKYKLPDIKRKQLDLNFNLSETYNNDKSEPEGGEANSDTDFGIDNSTRLGYRSFINSGRFQSEQHYLIRFSPEFEKQKDSEGALVKKTDISSGFEIHSENRIYFRNQYFFEADVNSYGNFSSSKTTDKIISSIARDRQENIFAGLPLMVGKGRIEPVQDARLAIYILQELEKAGRIANMPDNEEIIEFAELISKLKNERFFDYRLKRIAEIEEVDSFLRARGYVNQADASYFTTVYDNWEYSTGSVRESGTRISVGVNPMITRSRTYSRYEIDNPPQVNNSETKFHRDEIQFIANFISERPLNLYWQNSFGASASYNIEAYGMKNIVQDTEYKYKDNRITASMHYELGYYPNSRTNMSARFYLSAEHSIMNYENSSDDFSTKELELFPGFVFYMNYYLSPQFRLQVQFMATNDYERNEIRYDPDMNYFQTDTKRLRQELAIGFLYSIF